MKAFTKIAIIAVYSLVAGFATAQPQPPTGTTPESRLVKLGLTEDQAKQVSDVAAKAEAAMVQQMAQLKVYNAQIEQAMVAAKPDLTAVNALVDKKTQLRGEMEKALFAVEVQIRQIVGDQLYPRVKQALVAGHRFGQFGKGRGRGMPGPGMGWNRSPAAPPAPQNP